MLSVRMEVHNKKKLVKTVYIGTYNAHISLYWYNTVNYGTSGKVINHQFIILFQGTKNIPRVVLA